MKTFKFHQDIKVAVWQRQFFEIEADNLEEAKKKALLFKVEDVSNYEEFNYSEQLDVEEELITPEDNNNNATIELYAEDNRLPFVTNALHNRGYYYNQYKDAHEVAYLEMAGFPVECDYHKDNVSFQAYHKNDKLNIMVFKPELRATLYTFTQCWDDLVNVNKRFRQQMGEYLRNKYKEEGKENEIHDWLAGHLTEMKATNKAVDNKVPFTLEDVVNVAGHMAAVREIQPAKLIGYQVVDEAGELPDGLFSFQIIEDKNDAEHILRKAEVEEPHLNKPAIYPVYEGDIEGPSFI